MFDCQLFPPPANLKVQVLAKGRQCSVLRCGGVFALMAGEWGNLATKIALQAFHFFSFFNFILLLKSSLGR